MDTYIEERVKIANEEHLRILRMGVSTWNSWRVQEMGTPVDLVEANLTEADLKWAGNTPIFNRLGFKSRNQATMASF